MGDKGREAGTRLVDVVLAALLFLIITGEWACLWVPPLVGAP